MRKFFNSFFLILPAFVFFLSCIVFIPQVSAKQNVAVSPEKKSPRFQFLYFVGNGDGTITDTKTGLMWVKKDSFTDLGKCLNWNDSASYVNSLTTGGYNDWRLPTVKELKEIITLLQLNNMNNKPTYWLWSSETLGLCCYRLVYSDGKRVDMEHRYKKCHYEGVRAVRNP